MDGYFQIHRQIFESWIFADDKALKIFLWLLGKARHKNGIVPIKVGKGLQYIDLKRGQMIFGRFAAEEALFYNGSLIYRKMQKMQDDDTIKVESNNQYSIVTICNYEEYQTPLDSNRTTNDQQTNKERSANSQPTDTNKNVNKGEELKEDKKYLSIWENFPYKTDFKKVLNLFEEKFIPNTPTQKIEWLDTYEKAVRLDGYSSEKIVELISWAREDDFWISNLMSLASLRKKGKSGIKKIDSINAKFSSTKAPVENKKDDVINAGEFDPEEKY